MRNALGILGLIIFTGLASAQSEPVRAPEMDNPALHRSEVKVYQISRKDAVSVRFPEGTAELSPAERAKLDDIVRLIQERRGGQIFIAAWSDKQAPSRRSDSLPRQDQDLANERLQAVQNVLRERDVRNPIDQINMATYPSRLAALFNTRNTVIKGKGRVRNQQAFVIDQMGDQMRRIGGPGSAVVVVLNRQQPGRDVSH